MLKSAAGSGVTPPSTGTVRTAVENSHHRLSYIDPWSSKDQSSMAFDYKAVYYVI